MEAIHYKKLQKLGLGSFGVAYKVRDLSNRLANYA